MSFQSIDNRSKKFVLIPFCLQCQAAQASGIVKQPWSSSITPIMELLIRSNLNIIQMPCPETLYYGLVRKPMGFSKYDSNDYREHCANLAHNLTEMVTSIKISGYDVVAILGIDLSPSCAVNYVYTHKGMIRRKGLFLDELSQELSSKQIEIPFIGINRRSVTKSQETLMKILNAEGLADEH